jgi:hypothetical protein
MNKINVILRAVRDNSVINCPFCEGPIINLISGTKVR